MVDWMEPVTGTCIIRKTSAYRVETGEEITTLACLWRFDTRLSPATI